MLAFPPAVVEHSLHAMAALDDALRCREANHAACVLLKRSREEIVGRSLRDFSTPEAVGWIDERSRRLLTEGTDAGRWPLSQPDGRVLEVEYFATANVRPGRHLVVFDARSLEDPPASGAGGPLTARELEVLRLLALGCTGPEIAERLVVTVDTVRTHIRRLKAKLSARTLPHLIALALRDGHLDGAAVPRTDEPRAGGGRTP